MFKLLIVKIYIMQQGGILNFLTLYAEGSPRRSTSIRRRPLYAEGGRRRMSDAVTAPAGLQRARPRVHLIRRGLVYAEGYRRRISVYAEGFHTPTAFFVGYPGAPLRRRHRPLAVGVGAGRRQLC